MYQREDKDGNMVMYTRKGWAHYEIDYGDGTHIVEAKSKQEAMMIVFGGKEPLVVTKIALLEDNR